MFWVVTWMIWFELHNPNAFNIKKKEKKVTQQRVEEMRVYLMFGGWKGLKCNEFDQESKMLDGFHFECFGYERRKKEYIGKKRKEKRSCSEKIENANINQIG